jgi:hypothetical protein
MTNYLSKSDERVPAGPESRADRVFSPSNLQVARSAHKKYFSFFPFAFWKITLVFLNLTDHI